MAAVLRRAVAVMARRAGLIVALLSALLLHACGGRSGDGGGEEQNLLFRADAAVLKPFVWFYADLDNSDAGFDRQLEFGDPFRVTTLLMQDWLARRDLASARARADKVIARWRLDAHDGKLDYRFAYRDLPVGWWSGMDSWSLPVLMLSLWQDSGDARYKAVADKLIASAARSADDGGVVWRDGGTCWFSAYVTGGMTRADEWYVLNSHLYSLASVRLLADVTGDGALAALYRCGVAAAKSLAPRFAIGTQWLRYMLTPSTINQTHYVVYESMLFDALARLDPDPFHAEQAALRRALLRRYFPVTVRETGTGRRLSMSALGAPHPYSIDTYALSLTCRDGRVAERHEIADPTNLSVALVDRVFLDAPTALDPATATCRVEARNAHRTHLFHEGPVSLVAPPSGAGTPIDARLDASLDAQLTDATTVVIDPARRVSAPGEAPTYLDTQGRIVLTPASAVPWAAEGLLGIEFGADGGLSIGVSIVSKGVEYFRYYPRTVAAPKLLVLLSPVGFDGGDAIREVGSVTVFAYTDGLAAPVTVRAPRLLRFANALELREYFVRSGALFTTE